MEAKELIWRRQDRIMQRRGKAGEDLRGSYKDGGGGDWGESTLTSPVVFTMTTEDREGKVIGKGIERGKAELR